MPEREGDKSESWREDVEELRGVLSAVSDFIASLKEPIKDLLSAIAGPIEGGKLGREVGDFYRGLKESGVPDDIALQMTREYFKRRLESLPSISSFIEALREAITSGRGIGFAVFPKKAKRGEVKEGDEEKEEAGGE